jgi:putative NADH-flavin reductase
MRSDVSQMRIAVVGASGGTGRHVVSRALARGHEVVAVVRRPGSLERGPGLREALWPDVGDADALTEALSGADVVIYVLGGADKGATTVCTDGTRTLLPAMRAAGVERLVAVSAHGSRETHDRSLYSRAVWAGVGEKMKDKETMELLIDASDRSWTIVRPPTLTNAAATGSYRTGDDLPIRLWHSIGRADLADFLVREAEDPAFVTRYPRIRS